MESRKTEDLLKWEKLNISYLFNFFEKYQHIYIEALCYPNLLAIYKKCDPAVPIEIIEEESLIEGCQSILIWEENIHDELACEKINCKELYRLMYEECIASLKRTITIKDEWASIEEKEVTFGSVVECFDNGNATVCVVNENKEFLYALCQGDVKKSILISEILRRTDWYVDDTDDRLENLAQTFYEKNEIQEIPVLKNRKIIALAARRKHRKQVLRWDWIEDGTITQIWKKDAKLLVSSLSDDIQGFVDRFACLYDIEVFSDKLYKNYRSGKYSALIYSADVWMNFLTERYYIKQVYLDCLANDMLKWFQENQISYHYFEMPWGGGIYQFEKRWVSQMTISGDNIEINGCYFQRDIQKEGFHVYGGRRITVGEPEITEHTIYVFGPCIALGSFVVDEDTIESKLQYRLNHMHLNYKVVNCGGGNSPYQVDNDINSFYTMINTKFKPGDIVIHFGSCVGRNVKLPRIMNCHSCTNAFNEKDVLNTKCFSPGVAAHLNAMGNSIIERFVFTNIEKELKNELTEKLDFVSYKKNEKQVDNDGLRTWLEELHKNKTNYQKVGCIVMNCNPFTKGHYYLIDQSRKEVEYLYIFVVEEDRSDFSFTERYEMVVNHCVYWDNVKVMPSGKYIISALTFEEYFNKDSLQEETVIPAMDIQLFAKYVAPALNITVRFVGEETVDRVTAQYNKMMKEMLPAEGIDVVEYPRYAIDGEVVSASTVRKCIVDKQWEALKKYLTDESYQYICEKYNIRA